MWLDPGIAQVLRERSDRRAQTILDDDRVLHSTDTGKYFFGQTFTPVDFAYFRNSRPFENLVILHIQFNV